MRIHWREEFRSLFSLIAFVSIVALVFRSWQVGLIWASSLGIHELGHILAISLAGIDWTMGFGLLGAWTRTSLEERQALSHFRNSIIHLAGPLFSLLYALAALGVVAYTRDSSDRLLHLANFSAWVGLLNLLPLGRLTDGGKLVQRVMASLNEREEKAVTWLPILFGLATVIVVLSVQGLGRLDVQAMLLQVSAVLLIPLWLLIGMLHERRLDEPEEASSPRAMNTWEARGLMLAQWIMLLASTLLVLITPFWLTVQRTLDVVEGFKQVWPIAVQVALFASLVIVLMVMHELGHYAVARLTGLRVNRMVVGRPESKLLTRFTFAGQTIEVYTSLPVLMALDVDDDVLVAAGSLKRSAFALAGPVLNLASVVLVGWLAVGGAEGARLGLAFILRCVQLVGVFFLGPFSAHGSARFFGLYQEMAAAAAAAGLGQAVVWWMLLNCIVGIANLLPLPGMDGGLILLSALMKLQTKGRATTLFERWYGLAPRLVAWLPWILIGLSLFHLVRFYIGS